MIKKQLLLSLLAMVSHVQTGVYILAELPNEVTEIIQEAQDVLSKKIGMINERDNGNYIFQNAQFSPHLSLAFVSQEELPIQEVKQKFSGLIEELQQIAGKHRSIDLSKNFADAAIDYWPGKFEVECGGSKKKNYLNVVLKASNNLAFANLAQDVSTTLEDKYNVKQRFPFSTHITIGRICDKNDSLIDLSLKQKLEAIVISTEKKATVPKPLSILIEELKLKGHDGSEEKFVLLKNN
jgi:2'-5' RNA ligase